MTRDEAIACIENLYPADSVYEPTAKIGHVLLDQAKREVNGWRTEPTAVLVRYAQLCIEAENREGRTSTFGS